MAILSAETILNIGLRLAGCTQKQRNSKITTQITRFKACFGSHPLVYARLWHELRLVDLERKLVYFFVTLYWFQNYDTESVLACKFGYNEDTVRDCWCWYYAECMEVLEDIKVCVRACGATKNCVSTLLSLCS